MRSFRSLLRGVRGLSGAVFSPSRQGARGLPGAVFSPSPQRGEGIVRGGLFTLSLMGRGGLSGAVFSPSPQGARELPGAGFSPSPLWGEGRGEGRIYDFALTFAATSSAVSSISVPEITSGDVRPKWSSATPPTAAPQVFASWITAT